jgi:endonuclease-3 related protein
VIIGAILTQNTAWTNVEKAITALKRAEALTPRKMKELPLRKLAALIRPSGYYNVKARRIKSFIQFLFKTFDGNLNNMFSTETGVLRGLLLGVSGIGPETADSILLYAGNKPVFVVDAYTRRIFGRLGFLDGTETYGDIQDFFMKCLPEDVPLYNDYHAQIVALGKNVCRPKPRCGLCPVRNNACNMDAKRVR